MDGRTRTLVIASLVVNLFLAGVLIGLLFVGAKLIDRRDGDRRGGDRPGMWTAFQNIPPERRQELQRLLRAPAVEAAPDLRAAREARRRAAELIGRPQYDAAGVTAALSQARESDAAARAKIDAAFAAKLSQLSAEERAAFSQAMMRGPRFGDRGRGGDGDRRGPPDGR